MFSVLQDGRRKGASNLFAHKLDTCSMTGPATYKDEFVGTNDKNPPPPPRLVLQTPSDCRFTSRGRGGGNVQHKGERDDYPKALNPNL